MRSEKLRVKREKYKFREFGAITLISLVITIVVLIILSSIAIYLSLGNNGIFKRAKEAKEVTNKQQATDIINLKITTAQMNKYAEKQKMPTLQELADILYEDNEIQYVALETKVGAKQKITVGEKTSIFTKLNQYPYEFEINSSLQLASINGVKLATTQNNNQNKISLIYDTEVSNAGEYKLKESVENYDIIVVVGVNNYNTSGGMNSSGHTFILTKGMNEKERIRIGLDDRDDMCMEIRLIDDNLIILYTWNYKIRRIYGINL